MLALDGDIYPEEIGVAPLTGVVSCSDDSRLDLRTMRPRGRRLRRAYEFEAGREAGTLSALTVARAIQAATTEEETAARRGTKPPEGVSFGHGDLPTADGGSVWTCCGPPGAARNGKKLEATDGAWTRLNELLLTTAGGTTLVCSTAVYDGTEHGEDEEGGDINLDARVLSVQRTAGGERRRNFKDAVEELVESEWEGWPVHGPRTFMWCCRFIVEFALHPLAHHTRFVQLAQISQNDPGAQEHELAMRVIEYSITFDQLQGGELACLEVMARRAQLIELRHRDKVIGNNLGITVDDDTHIYLGTGRTRGLLMVSPALEEFVAKELSRETSAAKERRKLREERSGKPSAKK